MKAQRNLMVYHGWYIKYSFPTHTFYMVVYLQCTPRFFWKESSVLPMLHKHPYIPLLQSYNPILAMQYHNIWNSPSYTHVAEISRTAHCAHIADTFYVAQPFWYSKETNNGTWYHMSRKRHVICWEKDGTCIGLSTNLHQRINPLTSIAQVVRMVRSLGQKLEDRQLVLLSRQSDTLFWQICLFCLSVSSCHYRLYGYIFILGRFVWILQERWKTSRKGTKAWKWSMT